MICKHCGAKLNGEWFICPDCSHRVDDDDCVELYHDHVDTSSILEDSLSFNGVNELKKDSVMSSAFDSSMSFGSIDKILEDPTAIQDFSPTVDDKKIPEVKQAPELKQAPECKGIHAHKEEDKTTSQTEAVNTKTQTASIDSQNKTTTNTKAPSSSSWNYNQANAPKTISSTSPNEAVNTKENHFKVESNIKDELYNVKKTFRSVENIDSEGCRDILIPTLMTSLGFFIGILAFLILLINLIRLAANASYGFTGSIVWCSIALVLIIVGFVVEPKKTRRIKLLQGGIVLGMLLISIVVKVSNTVKHENADPYSLEHIAYVHSSNLVSTDEMNVNEPGYYLAIPIGYELSDMEMKYVQKLNYQLKDSHKRVYFVVTKRNTYTLPDTWTLTINKPMLICFYKTRYTEYDYINHSYKDEYGMTYKKLDLYEWESFLNSSY